MKHHTDERLESLRTSLRIALSDDTLTSEDIIKCIRSTFSDLSVDLRARAAKASNVADMIREPEPFGTPTGTQSYDFISFGDTIVRPDEDDAYDPLSYYGAAAQAVPMFGAGQDTISLNLSTGSSSSDTISF